MLEKNSEELLRAILATPTAPFREGQVIDLLTRRLREAGVPHFQDPVGNLIVGAASARDYAALLRRRPVRGAKSAEEPVRIFIAHLDHPGFHGVRWRGERALEVRWYGGSPIEHLDGARVWLASNEAPAGELAQGDLREVKIAAGGRSLETAVVELTADDARALRARQADAAALYGGFRFREPVWREGDHFYTKAADDLVGAFAITALALEKWAAVRARAGSAGKKELGFLGLLTRAEEVGFIGAIGHFELGWIPAAKRPVLCVSLETSRTLPGAIIGEGPIVRLGDRLTVFDPGALKVFWDLAKAALPDRFQRRVMDAGACEATVAVTYGVPCVGISVPLGNYHNQSFEGGPDSRGPMGPAPEFVHAADVAGLLTLCRALLKPRQPWAAPWAGTRRSFRKSLRGYRALLRGGR